MKVKLNTTIRHRIHLSFSLLVLLFVVNAVITIVTINNIKKLSGNLSNVVDPSLQGLDEFKKLMLESKMYSTNWVFLRSSHEDKELLEQLHATDYPELKNIINSYVAGWENKKQADSLQHIFTGFEDLLAVEKNIMYSLKTFEDYDDPVIKLEAERKIEEEVLPRTSYLLNELQVMDDFWIRYKAAENAVLERTSMRLRMFIILLAITIVCAGGFLSVYMSRIIIRPVNKIKTLINDLGKGIIGSINQPVNRDEIGEMVHSVNNLSAKLSITANFAEQVGNRNFETFYEPLSDQDTLGRALIAMRDSLRKSDTTLENKNKELKRKNSELEQFAYIASHDLQEPLRTTSSFVQLLKDQYLGKLDAKADKYLSYILQSSERMRVLINDLLEYSRIGNKKELEQIDCNKMVKEVLEDMGKTITDEKAVIKTGKLPVIKGYRTEMKQLFQNLVANAIKFRKKEVTAEVIISANEDKAQWNFAVSDNGIGITENHRERIFIIFQRLHTRTEYDGSGIGLAHCQKIVGLHGGKIWAGPSPAQGTTFHFNIPKINN